MSRLSKYACGVVAALAIVANSTPASAATVVVENSTAPWLAFMNWFHVFPSPDPALGAGSPWGIADLTAVFDDGAGNVTLGPNTIDVPADDAYWYINGDPPLGTKVMEANLYREETGPLAGQTVTFVGNVESFGLSPDYEARVFVRDFAPDYATSVNSFVDITSDGSFSVSLDTIDDPTRHVQYGIQVLGRNIFPTNTDAIAAAGTLVITTIPEPATGCLLALGGLALVSARRRKQ